MDKRMIDEITDEYHRCHSIPSKCDPKRFLKKTRYEETYVDISDEVMEDTHFSRFDRLPYLKNETNRMYLSRILGLENIVEPISYLARGMENIVFRARGIGRFSGDDFVIRIARFGDDEYDTTYLWSENSFRVQLGMYNRFSESNLDGYGKMSIPVPELVFRDEVPIGNTVASVQVIRFVKGVPLEEKFRVVNKKEREILIYKFGNTLGHLHFKNKVIHGDYHAMNVMVSNIPNEDFLTIIDMDRSIDNSSGSVLCDEDLHVSMEYDLTQALSSIFKMISIRFSNVKSYKSKKENLFRIFMDAYNTHYSPVYGSKRKWVDILHIGEETPEDDYMKVLQEGFSGYDDIFNNTIGI